MEQRQFLLSQNDIPKQWYNIVADLHNPPAPPLHPGTKQPAGPDDLSAIFCDKIIEQEVTDKRWVDIPDDVREGYTLWRPTPMYRATRLEKALQTPAKIFFKYEGTSPVGSHKLNTALPQAYFNKLCGVKRLATETGAGQWGCALSLACNTYGMECTVYMVRVSFKQKPYRKSMMHAFGAKVHASPSHYTEFGRKLLAEDPEMPGSLGIAISEALEDTVTHKGVKYSLGSVANHVMLHQTVIGEECKKQMKLAGVYPDIVIGCAGGGSNFAGVSFPFVADKLAGKDLRIIAVEPSSCPSLTKGEYRYDFGDTANMTPLFKMYTLGSDFMPPSIHAGGLRYHGMSPLVSQLYNEKVIEAVSYPQLTVFEAALEFARTEGIIPAPESSHAIRCAIDEAVKAKEEGKEKVILFNLSGNGYLDLGAYDSYFSGQMTD